MPPQIGKRTIGKLTKPMNGNSRGGGETPFRQIASLLIAGTYYLVLHRHTSTFGDMDYDTPDGPVRLKKVLHEILDMLYERLERPQG